MILYHGTTMEITEPKILRSEIGRDFGFAFYTTDIQGQAECWAVRKARIENRRPGKVVKPIVNVYEWNDDVSSLRIKRFDDASLEWLEMVVQCRGNTDYQYGYDKQETKAEVDNLIRDTLWAELPESYNEISISGYRQKIYEYVYTRYPEAA